MPEYDDAGMINHPESWPCWPYLPVVRRRGQPGGPDCGLLVATEAPWSAVYMANLFSLPRTREEFIATKRHTYGSVQELLADGWEVD